MPEETGAHSASPCAVFVERFDGPAALVLRTIEPREPGVREVLIDVHAAGVNFPDLLVSRGRYQDLYPLPFIIGKEGAGIVRAIGPGVTSVAAGDRVAFHLDAGAFSERVLVPSAYCYHVPSGLSLFDAAGSVLAPQTAWFALTDRGMLQRGEWVLVLGATGGVGIAAVQLARLVGARVIGGIHGMEKRSFVESHGADAVVDLSEPDLADTLRDRIRAVTNGRGVDLVVDTTGGHAFQASLRTLEPGGRVAVVGFTSGTIPSVKVNHLLLKHLSVVGVNWGIYREREPARVSQVQRQIFGWMADGLLRSAVTERMPLSHVSAALNALERRRARGKIVLTTRFSADNSGDASP